MKYKTIPYKGSKRKLLDVILKLAKEIEAETFLDGFSGTGIVSAHMRKNGYKVYANDKMTSANLYSRVFLNGFDEEEVARELKIINNLTPVVGWITNNYSGTKARVIRGTKGQQQNRPLGFLRKNATKIDAAREYAETILNPETKDAVVFSIVLAANKVFNNSNDQKSCLKEWSDASKKGITFQIPTLVKGIKGKTFSGEVHNITKKDYDIVYLDPPYTTGVLYDSCYHLNDSIVNWNKPTLDYSYAIPRPESVCFRKNNQNAGTFYIKKNAINDFTTLLSSFTAKRIILSYSDAPRNVLTYDELAKICNGIGKLKIITKDHKICSQNKNMNKTSDSLKEFFFIIDK